MSIEIADAEDRPEPVTDVDAGGAETEANAVRSTADGGIVAQLRLDHSRLFLAPALREAPEITVEPDYWTEPEPGRTVVFVTAHGTEFEAFETGLESDPTVTDPVLVDRYPDRRVYRVMLTDRAVTFTAATAAVGGRLLDCSSCRAGWRIQLRFPDRERLVAFNDYCRERDVSITVDHLRVSDEEDDGVVALTDKQQELLTVAHEEGYFEVPRGISQDELARRLGVSKSAVSQRLRRAIGELCAQTL